MSRPTDGFSAITNVFILPFLSSRCYAFSLLCVFEEKMAEAGFSEERIEEARILYEYSLFRFSTEENFTDRFVGCFAEEQTVEKLIAAVNAEFGTAILPEEFRDIVDEVKKQKEEGETEE